jgi:hypothetical protein
VNRRYLTVVLSDRVWRFIRSTLGTRQGYCDHNKRVICVDRRINRPNAFHNVFTHECLHAIFPNMSEDQIEQASTELTMAQIAAGIRFVEDK